MGIGFFVWRWDLFFARERDFSLGGVFRVFGWCFFRFLGLAIVQHCNLPAHGLIYLLSFLGAFLQTGIKRDDIAFWGVISRRCIATWVAYRSAAEWKPPFRYPPPATP